MPIKERLPQSQASVKRQARLYKSCMFATMPKKTRHKLNFRYVLVLSFILFALSPCIVKGALWETVTAENYIQPLNKSQTAVQEKSCQFKQDVEREVILVKKKENHKEVNATVYYDVPSATEYPSFADFKNFQKTLGNKPPSYILFKRLKIATA